MTTPSPKPLVAIIEDDAAIVQMYRTKLMIEGFDVVTATDGEKGLAMLEKVHPDVILLDLMMPSMSGLELLSQIKLLPKAKTPKIAVLTNVEDPTMEARAHEIGVDLYLIKTTTTPSGISEKVNELLAG